MLSMIFMVSALTGCQAGDDAGKTTAAAESTVETQKAESAEETETEQVTQAQTENAVQTETTTEPAMETEADLYAGLTYYESLVGISLYMSDGFTESSVEGVLACYEGENSNVRFERETFETLASIGYGDVDTLDTYAGLIIQAYQLESEVQTDEYGNVYIVYAVDIQGTSVSYYAFFDKGTDSFWMTTFMCLTAQKNLFEEDFKLWASSVQVP